MTLGVAALVVALALMNGYAEALRRGILAGSGHVVVLFAAPSAAERAGLAAAVAGLPGVTATGDAVYLPGLLGGDGDRTEVVQVKATEVPVPFAQWTEHAGGPLGVAVGAGLAASAGLSAGSTGSLQLFVDQARLVALPVRVDTVFATGFAELDERWVMTSLSALRRRLPSIVPSAHEIFLADPDDAGHARDQLEAAGLRGALVTTWEEANRSLFAALRWQKLSLALVLSLVVGVGAFEVASALVVLVTEKRRDIGVLLAMGSPPGMVREVLVLAGGAIGAAGLVAGLALGLLVVGVMSWLGQPHFPREIASIYMVERIPFVVRATDLATIVLVGLAEVTAAALVPALRAASKEPAEVLRWV